MPSLLLVDDDQPLLKLIEQHFKGTAFRCQTAVSAMDAMSVLRVHYPDIILLDVHLPDNDGLRFMQNLKSEPALRSIPVIIMTSDLRKELVLAARNEEAADFLAKPFTREVLLRKVNRIWSLVRLERRMKVVNGEANIQVNLMPGLVVFAVQGDFSPKIIPRFRSLLSDEFRDMTRRDSYVLDLTAQPDLTEQAPVIEELMTFLDRDDLRFVCGRNYAVLLRIGVEPEGRLFVTLEDLEQYLQAG